MAGLPWLFVFALLAWLAVKREWGFAYGLFVFCMGVVSAAGFGGTIAGFLQEIIGGSWAFLIDLLNRSVG
jgi:hypothetical protein